MSGGPDATKNTGFNQGEFLEHQLQSPGNGDPLVAAAIRISGTHDFFVNPSTDAFSTIESLMAVDGSSALRPITNRFTGFRHDQRDL